MTTTECFLLLMEVPTQENSNVNSNGSPYSTTERMVPELIPVLCSQHADDVSHKPGCRPPLLFARPAVTLAEGCYQFRSLVNRSTMGVNSLPMNVTRQHRGCDLNPHSSLQ